MGYTIGDVLTIISLIAGFLVALWAMTVAFAMLFHKKAETARGLVEDHPWRSFFVGAFLAIIAGGIALRLSAQPNGVLRLIGYIASTYLVIVTATGGSGLAMLIGERIHALDRRRSRYSAIGRAAALMVLFSLLPVFGWLMGAITAVACLGAGFQAMLHVGEKRYATQFSQPMPTPVAATASNEGDFVV